MTIPRDVARLEHEPIVGRDVVVSGRLTVYAAHGKLQCVVRDIQVEEHRGAAAQSREQILSTLRAEGLLTESRKRAVPRQLKAIGVVTSAGSAALGDIIAGVRTRAPWVRVVVAEATIQGTGAPASIAAAVSALSSSAIVDTIVIARGGGSTADLAAFDAEIVARAVADSEVPVISAIGHELHVTVADVVADLRAATPSAAAALALPDQRQVRRDIDTLRRSACTAARRALEHRMAQHTSALDRLGPAAAAHLALAESRIRACPPERVRNAVTTTLRLRAASAVDVSTRASASILQRVQSAEDHHERACSSATGAITRSLETKTNEVAVRSAEVDGVSPLRRMAAGYAFLEKSNGTAVTSASGIRAGEMITANVRDGRIHAVVTSCEQVTENHGES